MGTDESPTTGSITAQLYEALRTRDEAGDIGTVGSRYSPWRSSKIERKAPCESRDGA